MNEITFDLLRERGDLLFESIRGSHLFGLDTPTSDRDTFGVFCGPAEWFLGTGISKTLIVKSEKNDDYWDELEKYFLELGNSNPEALVSLFTPPQHILHFDPVLQPLWDIRDALITKKCFKSFSGYAESQIKKARGLKKASGINPAEVKDRKNPLKFCQVPVGGGTWTLEKYLLDNGLKQEYCGISRLPGTVESYALYYDWAADPGMPRREDKSEVIGYRGILSTSDPLSSQLRLSSIPKSEAPNPICYFQFNSGAYSQHCVDYKRYWEWVRHRNPERWESNKEHTWDAKNMSHCIRIMTMAKEIANGQGMRLDRSGIDRDWLLKIKNHGVSYEEIMEYTQNLKEGMLEAFEKSVLPEEPDKEVLDKLLTKIREKHYGRSYIRHSRIGWP